MKCCEGCSRLEHSVNEVQPFLLEGRDIRGAVVRLNETWQQIVAQHRYPAAVGQVLGEGVAAALLLANGLKDGPRVSLQLQGNGPLRMLIVQCARNLSVRGMAQWRSFAPGDAMLGEGRLAVMLDTGRDQGVFQGIVPLVSSSLDACLEAYFRQSEQLPTRIVLVARARSIGGLLLQTLPGSSAEIENFDRAAACIGAMQADELLALPASDLLPRLFGNYAIRLFEPRPVLHDCRCTPDHLAGIARMLGEAELRDILLGEGRVELTCEFCNRAFRYDEDDVEAILRGETPVAALH
jgi:molecular chaperone Hsp33